MPQVSDGLEPLRAQVMRRASCDDLLDSMMDKPSLEFFIDDMAAAEASLARLRSLDVGMVYPGHGKPFRLEQVK